MRIREQLDFIWDIIMDTRHDVKENPLLTGKFVQDVLAISDKSKRSWKHKTTKTNCIAV